MGGWTQGKINEGLEHSNRAISTGSRIDFARSEAALYSWRAMRRDLISSHLRAGTIRAPFSLESETRARASRRVATRRDAEHRDDGPVANLPGAAGGQPERDAHVAAACVRASRGLPDRIKLA